MSDYTPAVAKPIVENSDLVQALADVPDDLSASELKERFDRVPLIVKSSVDDLVDELGSIQTAINSKANAVDVYTKTETDNKLDLKADADSVYTKTETDGFLDLKADASEVYTNSEMDVKLEQKADASSVYTRSQLYTKEELDVKLSLKSDSSEVYTKTQVDDKLELKADASDVYTKSETDSKLNLKANSLDVYTRTETDGKLNLKANLADVYTKTQVDDLLEGAGGGKSYSTIVMGTSAAGYTASDVDYLCSGSNDSTQFTAALGALPSTGGRILMLEGTYRLQNISIAKSGVVIEGMGEGTVIEHADRSSGEYTTPIITVGSSLSGIKIKNLKMFGGFTQYDKSVVYAVAASSPMELSGVTFNDFSSFSNGTVSNISFEGCSGLEIPELGSSNSIKGCDCELGIISGDKNIISGCLLKSCAANYTCYTISGDGNIISGCIIAPEFMDTFMTISGAGNLLSSNTITTSAYTGISVTGAKNIVNSNHIEFTMASSYSTGISVGTGSIACGNVVKGSITGSGTFSGLNITS